MLKAAPMNNSADNRLCTLLPVWLKKYCGIGINCKLGSVEPR